MAPIAGRRGRLVCMDIPIALSVAATLPVAARGILAVWHWKIVRRVIPGGQKRVEQHRSLIAGLAAFSLAGFALVGVQDNPEFGPPLFVSVCRR